MTRRSFINGVCITSVFALCGFKEDSTKANDAKLAANIEKWARKHAHVFSNSSFAEEVFIDKKSGQKFHSAQPVNFVLLPMKDGKISKHLVEFPAAIRHVYVNDNADNVSWKEKMYCQLKDWFVNEAYSKLSKLPNVDFEKASWI